MKSNFLRFLSSNSIFYITLGLFVASGTWIVFSSLYPMAFDEEFHYGLVQLYSLGITPYDVERTVGMAQYGAATADPSYLMQYLLSFPYRILLWAGLTDQVIIIVLRLFNLAFVVAALVLFRKAIHTLTKSRTVANLSIATFTLIPILPVMAGQINYDNLLLLVVAGCLYFTARITKSIRSHNRLPAFTTWLFVATLILGASVKYGYLPIGAAFVAWLVLLLWIRRKKTSVLVRIKQFWGDSLRMTRLKQGIVVILLALGLFFSFKYVVNIVEFGKPIPNCETVFDDRACTAYGPWYRNYLLAQEKPDDFQPLSFPGYVAHFWLPDMAERLTFVVSGPTNDYDTKESLPFIKPILLTFTALGLIGIFYSIRRIRKESILWLSVLVFILYVAPLAVRLYGSYKLTAEPVAINGRYLLPLLPLFTALLIVGIRASLVQRLRTILVPTALVALVMLIFAGGGAVSYIVLAESSWFWPGFGQNSHMILKALFEHFVLR